MSSNVDLKLVGEAWPVARPFADQSLYGSVSLDQTGAFPVRSHQTFTLIYTAGRYGVDDSGGLKVAFRHVGDMDRLQTTDPTAPNYVSARADNGVNLVLEFAAHGLSARPRNKALAVQVNGGYLREGDKITIVLGDRSAGSPGLRLQTFAESACEFLVSVDPCAVGHFIPLTDSPEIAVIPGEPVVYKAVLPSLRRPGEPFRFGFKGEDIWGNPTDLVRGNISLRPNRPIKGLPGEFEFSAGERSVVFDDLTDSGEGVYIVEARDEGGELLAQSNPMLIRAGDWSGYWGDLHGQSGETVGTGSVDEYFDFARDKAFLDATSHQGNDFQVTKAFWEKLNRLTADYQADGKFVALPGYEWSGNTGVGGDRNVFFKAEGRQIRRSSHALLTDQSDIETDAQDGRKLFRDLTGEDCLAYAHVGGRYANIDFAHDPVIETAMEIHSAWGTFEWLMGDCFRLGHRVGVVANSDDHKARPGASHPGASTFGAYGGLTCFLTGELTRDGIFDCLRKRRHYATTGCRLHLDVRADLASGGLIYDRDPKAHDDAATRPGDRALMGDIVQTETEEISLAVEALAPAGIDRIDVLNGLEVVETFRTVKADDLGGRIRVLFSGAEYRGRGRETRWQGRARFDGATIKDWRKINVWNPERRFEIDQDRELSFDAITTGNFTGFEVWLDERPEARLIVETNLGDLEVKLADLGLAGRVLDLGGLERRMTIDRLPDDDLDAEMKFEAKVRLKPGGDNPIWVRVTTEDGYQAWSSPIYLFR